jgi:hypothetical protein
VDYQEITLSLVLFTLTVEAEADILLRYHQQPLKAQAVITLVPAAAAVLQIRGHP